MLGNVEAAVRLRLKLHEHGSAAAVMQPLLFSVKDLPPFYGCGARQRGTFRQVYHAEKGTGGEEKHNNAAISDQIIIYRGVFNEDVSGRATICTSTIRVTCF